MVKSMELELTEDGSFVTKMENAGNTIARYAGDGFEMMMYRNCKGSWPILGALFKDSSTLLVWYLVSFHRVKVLYMDTSRVPSSI